MTTQYLGPISELVFGDVQALQTTPKRLTDVNSWHEHIPFAFWIMKKLAPSVFVELGVHKGDSYSAFCQAVQSFAFNTACYGVDTWKGEAHAGFYEEAIFREFSDYHDHQYASFSRLIRSTFDDALRYFSDGSIDLLHIDGRHGYDDVKHDFESWLPKLSSKAVVLFHDINVREREFGVWKFFHELSHKYSGNTFSFMHGHGLGVLVVGNKAPNTLQHLCRLKYDDVTYVQIAFATLGKLVKSQSTESSLRAKLIEFESGNRDNKKITPLNQEITDLDEQIEGLNLRLRKTEIEGYKVQFRLSCQLRQKDQAIAEKDQAIILLYNSRSMRLTKPLRSVLRLVKRIKHAISLSGSAIKHGGGLLMTFRKALRLYQMYGFEGIKRGLRAAAASKQQAS